jgi:peptidoglycan hydrolase-like protein with peptidoglycan-binding domain
VGALNAQRFRGVTTLERCVSEGYRMMVGEADSDAVTRVQDALADLGYLHLSDVDGQFGQRTEKAVGLYKTDRGFAQTDGVVSTGTMGALDAYFAGEAAEPDSDPSLDGLIDLALAAASVATGWLDSLGAAILRWPVADPDDMDPERRFFDAALDRHFGVAQTADRESVLMSKIAPVAAYTRKLLNGGLELVLMDHAMTVEVQGYPYTPLPSLWGGRLAVPPPFRNALDDITRAGLMLRKAILYAVPTSTVIAFPDGEPYGRMTLKDRIHNTVSYASFAYEVATQSLAPFRPAPLWYP